MLHLVIEVARSDNVMTHQEATQWAKLAGGHLPSLEELKALPYVKGVHRENIYWLGYSVGHLAEYYVPGRQLDCTDQVYNNNFAVAVKLIPLDVGVTRMPS